VFWGGGDYGALEGTEINKEDEKLYENARGLEFGDYNYPVITANRPYSNHRCGYQGAGNGLITTATNQALLRPSLQHKSRKGKSKSPPDSSRRNSEPLLRRSRSSSSSNVSKRSGVVDLVVEDTVAKETERVRARKEDGPGWNQVEAKLYVRKYPPEVAGEEIRDGFEPLDTPPLEASASLHGMHGEPTGSHFSVGDVEAGDTTSTDNETKGHGAAGSYQDDSPWRTAQDDERADGHEGNFPSVYGSLNERNVWGEH